MTVFRPKRNTAQPAEPVAGAIHWNYDRAEIVADGIVHGIGLSLGVIAAATLVAISGVFAKPVEIVSVAIYVAGLLAMLSLSAAYNLWPVSPRKWLLRRFDHSAIYVLIAATYTPFIVQIKNTGLALSFLAGVWAVAIVGIALKLLWPGRFDRVAIVLYLALGWSGFLVWEAVSGAVPPSAMTLLIIGGTLYSAGVIFHTWHRLRFQNAIWHGFVLMGAACHYTAVLDIVLA